MKDNTDMRFTTLILLISTTTASAEDVEWRTLYSCWDKHKFDVASVVESVDEGAGLLVDVLCLEESTKLGNAMMGTRKNVVAQRGFGEAFSDFVYVMKKEARHQIYLEKLKQR